jgi:hypothetical protein
LILVALLMQAAGPDVELARLMHGGFSRHKLLHPLRRYNMKKLVVLLMVSLMATSAFAVIDPDPDMVGVYFEPAANTNGFAATVNVPFHAYVVLTRPTSNVNGFEGSYRVVPQPGMEALMFRLGQALPAGAVDLGTSTNFLAGNFFYGLAAPITASEAVVLVDWTFMLLAAQTVEIFLGPSPTPSIPNGLPAYEAGGFIKSLGLSTGGVDIPVARVNGMGPVAIENESFGNVKALFR